jgi:hypothetical protein
MSGDEGTDSDKASTATGESSETASAHATGGASAVSPQVAEILAASKLTAAQTRYVIGRWGEEVVGASRKERTSRQHFYASRTVAVTGAVLLPPLISLQLSGTAGEVFRWIAFGLSLVVAIATALEELFRNGQRWRLYRGKRDDLSAAAWIWSCSLGSYAGMPPESDPAFQQFADGVETTLERYGALYVEEVLVPARPRPDPARNGDETETTTDGTPMDPTPPKESSEPQTQ